MGTFMARNLHAAGWLSGVWNRTPSKAQALAAELAVPAFADLTALAAASEAVVVCVSADADVRAVVAGLKSGLRGNAIVLDCSTIGAGTARVMHAELAASNVGFLDCPVSGGVEGARLGTLAVMVGGDESVFTRALPVLEKMGRTVTYMGSSGAGQAAKQRIKSCARASSRRSPKRWPSRRRRACRSTESSTPWARARDRAGIS